DFGITPGAASFITGAVYGDTGTVDNFYTPGEGLGGVAVQVYNAGTLTLAGATNTTSSGGYKLAMPNGAYDVKFSGGTLANPITYRNVMVSGSSVEIDSQSAWLPDTGGSWTNAASW